MAEHQVDVVEPEAPKGSVDPLTELLAVERVLLVRTVVDAEEDLRRDDVAASPPAELPERLASDLLGPASAVRLGVVEEVHARVPGGLHAGDRLGDAELRPEADPRPIREGADLQPRASEPSVFHAAPFPVSYTHLTLPRKRIV